MCVCACARDRSVGEQHRAGALAIAALYDAIVGAFVGFGVAYLFGRIALLHATGK